MLGIGLGLFLLLLVASAAGGKKVEKLDPNVDDRNAEAFNNALLNEGNPRELRAFATAALAVGAPNYARALIRKTLLLEGVPAPDVDAEVERHMQTPSLIQRPPRDSGTVVKETPAPAPGTAPPGPPPPGLSAFEENALLGAVEAVLATGNAQAMRAHATALRTPGATQSQDVLTRRLSEAARLEARANQIESQQQATPPALPPAQGGTPPFVPPPASGTAPPQPPAPAAGMPEFLRQMMVRALEDGSVQALGMAARVLEDAGFKAQADQLRAKARELAAATPPPPPEEQPSRTTDPTMAPELAAEIAKQLALQGDPVILRELAKKVRGLGFDDTAALLDAKAQQLQVLIDQGKVLQGVQDDIDEATKSPGQPQPDVTVSPQPGGGVDVTPPDQGGKPPPEPPAQRQPKDQPPKASPLPPAKTPLEVAAANLKNHLFQLIATHGFPGAKRKENTFLVKKFQAAAGDSNPDGEYGPGTALKLAQVEADVPPVFLWPTGASRRNVEAYRSELLRLANVARQLGNAQRAEDLERSAQRERGLGGVAGGPLAA